MKEMGFDDKWRNWVKECISTASISIIVNGAPCKPFKMGRGLRQGDPLSPFLFLMMAEVLNRLLLKAAAEGFFQGLHIGSGKVCITHLQFADDTILFCEPKREYLQNIKSILFSFQNFSGLSVNYAKSGLIVIGKEEGWAARAAEDLQCQLVQLPITYLGVPLGANMKKFSSWQPILDKIQHRLASWKASCLSRAGRLVLIKAVLNNLPVYYLSLFKIPKRVANEINKIQRKFLWNGKKEGRCSALVRWEIVQRPKARGGLGVGDLLLKNAALLFKWWWRYACEEGVLWRQVVQTVHEDDHVLLPRLATCTLPGPWRDIKRLATEGIPIKKAFFSNLKVQLGEESKLRFWLDPWAKEEPLKQVYNRLFIVSSQKRETISNMGWFEGQTWRWTLTWQRELTAEEQPQFSQLLGLLQHHHPVRNTRDIIKWGTKGTFAVKELISKANSLSNEEAGIDNLVCTVWKNLAPPKVEFMLWLALLGKLNTRDMLVKKGILASQENVCSFCRAQPEDIDHLLLQCQVSWNIWCTIAGDLGVQICTHNNFRQFYEEWMSKRVPNPARKRLYTVAFFAISWSLWTKRNKLIFELQELDLPALIHTIK